jgi:hypothetical protein
MSFLDGFFSHKEKSINTSIFSFFANSSIPYMKEKEYLAAYRGWVCACVNAIAEAFAEIEVKLQVKGKDGWQDTDEDSKALDLLHRVNDFQTFLDLTYSTPMIAAIYG